MTHNGGNTAGTPQEIEGISEVRWMNANVPKNIWESTYGSIRIVINAYSKTTEAI